MTYLLVGNWFCVALQAAMLLAQVFLMWDIIRKHESPKY